MRGEHLVQGFPEILQQMKAVRDLRGCGCPAARTLGIGFGPIARDDLHPRVGLKPLREGLGVALRQEGDGLPLLQVHQDRAISVSFPERPIIHAQHPGCGKAWQWQPAEHAEQGVPAHR
jgi:hypothetical protein